MNKYFINLRISKGRYKGDIFYICIKIKNLILLEEDKNDTINKIKRQMIARERVFTTYVTGKGLITTK